MSKKKYWQVTRQGALIWWGDSREVANHLSCLWPGSSVQMVLHYQPREMVR